VFSPQHNQVNQRLWFLARNVPESYNKVVEGRIGSGATDLLNLRLRVERDSDACIELFFGEGNELGSLLVCTLRTAGSEY
jgi:hypothetical protein